jgi:L-seryl-tRNA(Ser) seleniumtransferase
MENLKKIDASRLRVDIVELSSKAGGGALPLLELPSKCLRIQIEGLSANTLAINMRKNSPPIIGRIEDDAFIIDPRTLQDDDLPIIESAFEHVLKRVKHDQ